MSAPAWTWHLAISDGGVVADGVIGRFDTATEAARTASVVLHLVSGRLRAWAKITDPAGSQSARAYEIAGRLLSEAAELRGPTTEHGFAEVLEDPNLATMPLNTLALHDDFRHAREPFTDTPIPFGGRWSEQALWLCTWTTPCHDAPAHT